MAIIKPIIEEVKNAPDAFTLFSNLKRYPYAFFLDSARDHHTVGRYSFVGCDPFLVLKSTGDSVVLEWAHGSAERFSSDPFLVLKDLLKRFQVAPSKDGLPFPSGVVGYFSYDLKGFLEDLPERSEDDTRIPGCILGFYDTAVVYDNREKKCFAVSTGLPSGDRGCARSRLDELKKRIDAEAAQDNQRVVSKKAKPRSNFSKASYMRAVRKAKEYIRKGDIYQVNISQRFDTPIHMPALELYKRLRKFSPAPFAAYLDFKDVAILSSSPERFLLKRGSYIETRPIKGTRPRGKTAAEDRAMRRELVNSHKDRAEHIMIVDLERNDLGRICSFGSVAWAEPFVVEKYANVFHLVSTVSGQLKDGVGPVDCLSAAFPGGSITGAPKIRSMEIIDELEGLKRSAYTGALGYIGFDGNMDTSIVIRTFILKGSQLYFQVGGGIVADSDPEKEYEETIHKAHGLLQALGCVPPASIKTRNRKRKTGSAK